MISLSDKPAEESEMNIKRVGIDLAKSVFQLHGVDWQEKVILRKQLRRAQVLDFFFKIIAALFDWYGSLQQRALLGAGITKTGAYG